MLNRAIVNNIHNIIGEENALYETEELNSYKVDNIVPQAALFPKSVEQVSELLKLASKESISVVPMGSGTKIALGNKPSGADIVISTKNLDSIIEHGSSDLVATTQCGVTFRDFQQELGKQNQFLALDPPHVGNNATIGGIIATNDSGPLRLIYGTAREFLIGIKVVKADGSIFKGGSKVVKNVAGYDLPKLYVGSLGTLGIIVEATFRLYPIPEYSETFVASFNSLAQCHETILALLNSDLVLTALELLDPQSSIVLNDRINLSLESGSYTLLVGVRNVERAVKDQISIVQNICHANGGKGIEIKGENEVQLWDFLRDFPDRSPSSKKVICKTSVLVTQIPAILEKIDRVSGEANVHIYATTRAGNGISILEIDGNADSLIKALTDLRKYLTSLGGTLILQQAPHEIKDSFSVWGDIGSGLGIMKRIKTNFDPDNLLNPGRYV